MIIPHHKIVTFRANLFKNSSKKIFALILATLAFIVLTSAISSAAIVQGEGVKREVDAPTGVKTVDNLEESEREINNYSTQTNPGHISTDPAVTPNSQMPENYDKGENIEIPDMAADDGQHVVKQPKSSPVKFIVVGVIVVIIGLGIILGISKAQGRE